MDLKGKINQQSSEQMDKLSRIQSGDYKKIELNWKAIGIMGLIILVIINIIWK